MARLSSAPLTRWFLALTFFLCLTLTACEAERSDPAAPGEVPAGATAEDAAGASDVPDEPRVDWALALHGGAGVIPKDMEEGRKGEYFAALETALALGRDRLARGEPALDAVQAVVRFLEDDPKFNAGKGAVYTWDGRHELDAAIMDGRDLDCGSVAAVTTVKNPILLARRVLDRSPHVFLIGEGAEVFAREQGLEEVSQDYFHTERRKKALDDMKAEAGEEVAALGWPDRLYSTVGAVALDQDGNLAAATSTGGLTGKRFGRVGDVPVIGAGTYADNRTCAISGTGKGEQFIRHTVARSIAAEMEKGAASLEAAARAVIDGRLEAGDGGVVGVSRTGEIVWVFNSEGMFRGAADSAGRFEVGIWDSR
jgi:L-asparaginase / beta-aspartyl-peptidase